MKKLLILSAFALAGSALAQVAGPAGLPPTSTTPPQTRMGRKEREKMNQELLAKLNLTADQKTKIEAHEKEMREKVKALRKDGKGAGQSEESKEKLKALAKENREFMKSVLTKDQMREMMRLRREAMQARKTGGAPAPR